MKNSFTDADRGCMQRALYLASLGGGCVSPNPLVGAVIVHNNKIIAEGYHAFFGGPHAEVAALNTSSIPPGATLYVTLEPCIHIDKKTPPCVPLLLAAGFKRIVIAMKDPNPKVSGKAITVLKKSGLQVEVGCLEDDARKMNAPFIKWITTKMPFVAMKVGMTLDGKIATKKGESKWITGEQSRFLVRTLRDRYDAILVGSGTVVKDNPGLAGEKREPRRIILDSTLKIPLTSKVLRDSNVLLCTTHKAPANKVAALQKKNIPLKIFPKKIELTPLLRFLGGEGVSSVFVEGGSEVFGSFVEKRLVDKVYFFIAPKILGGRESIPAVGGKGLEKLNRTLNLSSYTLQKVGTDIFVEGFIK